MEVITGVEATLKDSTFVLIATVVTKVEAIMKVFIIITTAAIIIIIFLLLLLINLTSCFLPNKKKYCVFRKI